MFANFKIRISLWYAALFTIIIAATLLASYKIISYQLKNEIIHDLQSKTNFVSLALTETEESGEGEHGHGESEEEHHESRERKVKSIFSFDFNDIKMYTEVADNNYLLFIYSDDELIYMTEKYEHLQSDISKFSMPNKEINDIDINELPFIVSAIYQSNYSIYIGYELSSLTALQNKLLNIFLIVFPISLILSILCGFVVTQSTMNIINRINETTKKITSSNLSNRIEMPNGKDEISRLTGTLNSMIDRLEKSFTQAKQFSQDAAHEIRTPLTIIRGEIEELIENESGNNKTISTLENILEEVQYLSSISERLLLIHNMDTNNIKYHFEKIQLSELMKEIYQDVLVLSLEKNIKVDMVAAENITIYGNKELISRLLWNISDNAIKYNNPNGSVSINLYQVNSQIIIQVKDSGIGIPDKDITKIFDRFYRVDKSRSRQLGGSGLGLSICKWIAELHNGQISVESKEQIGSVFTIKFSSV